MCPDAPYFIILLCLMPDDFTRQEESTGAWVKQCICLVIRQVYSQLSRFSNVQYNISFTDPPLGPRIWQNVT
jgi:hypothetical protein